MGCCRLPPSGRSLQAHAMIPPVLIGLADVADHALLGFEYLFDNRFYVTNFQRFN